MLACAVYYKSQLLRDMGKGRQTIEKRQEIKARSLCRKQERVTTVGPTWNVAFPLFSGSHHSEGWEKAGLGGLFPKKRFLCFGSFSPESLVQGGPFTPHFSVVFFFFSLCQCDTPGPTDKPAGSGAFAVRHKHYCLLQWSASPLKKTACPPASAYLYNLKQYCGMVTSTTRPPR